MNHVYENFGPCCNACKYWDTEEKEEPCAYCTGGLTEEGNFSNFELHGMRSGCEYVADCGAIGGND